MLFVEMTGKFKVIGKRRLKECGDSAFIEPEDLINELYASNKLIDWVKRWELYDLEKRAPLKIWVASKFDAFCLDQLRKKRNKHTLRHDPGRNWYKSANKVTSVQMDDKIRVLPERSQINLAELLEELSPLERDIVLKIYQENMTLQEIADDLKCHKNTVWQIKKTALNKLK